MCDAAGSFVGGGVEFEGFFRVNEKTLLVENKFQ